MRTFLASALIAATIFWPSLAPAAEGDFLRMLAGSWSGRGTVLTRIGARPINITCNLAIEAVTTALSMQGNCRGLLVVRRNISANLQASDRGYRGTYVGPSGQPSTLAGNRRGNAINLGVRWARVTNGDRAANMTIERIGNDRLRLQTVDNDPASGKSVVTSRIDLSR
ncbi:hypothetical protein [Rhizobium sp. YS-1r]|uniref:DUF1579 domain-containing protein n=2 Tax=Neorhizobium TaxID=1525371 RepID=A0ABV0M3Z1_9HYPH|nr:MULTISPECIES: hypothetical protein [Rhizobium/Agrobacterium group]KGE02386.1 hypothetical protein JL39_02345 [Rhizobium sp. YS-1r]MCC2613532.1 hypothetical protein [Neorhizobium petrolearium]WGI72174.1 hypothetical protein QEO92_27270 [Neorhizobium petrolearium]